LGWTGAQPAVFVDHGGDAAAESGGVGVLDEGAGYAVCAVGEEIVEPAGPGREGREEGGKRRVRRDRVLRDGLGARV